MSFRGQTFFYCPKRSNTLSPSPKSRHIISHHSPQTYSIHTQSKQIPHQTTSRIQTENTNHPKTNRLFTIAPGQPYPNHFQKRSRRNQKFIGTISSNGRDRFLKASTKTTKKDSPISCPHKKRAGINPALFKYSMFIKPLLR